MTPSDQVREAVIGTGGMGGRHVEALAENPNCHLAGASDVVKGRYLNRLEKVVEMTGAAPRASRISAMSWTDDVDGSVAIARPLAPVADGAGLPRRCLCGEAREPDGGGRARWWRRRGAWARGAARHAAALDAGVSAAIDVIRSYSPRHNYLRERLGEPKRLGRGAEGRGQPAGLDWDLWLGPAPWEPFSMERYGGFMGNHDYARRAAHKLGRPPDGHRALGHRAGPAAERPGQRVRARGGAGAENFETIDALFEYPGVSVTWEQRFSNDKAGKGLGIMFQGTEGRLLVDRATYKVFPDTLGIEEFIGEPERSWANPDHHNNFFDCVRTRKRPAAEIEQGVRSTIPVLLAGIALKTRRKLNWDAANERFINDDAANRYLSRAYRPPWRLL